MWVTSSLDCELSPADGDADVAGDAAGKIDDLIADAIAPGFQVIGPELEYLLWDSCQRFLPARLHLVDGSALVGAEDVGKAVDLDFSQATSHGSLNDIGGKFDLLVFRKSGRLAEPFDQRSFLGFGGGRRSRLLVSL